MRSKHVILGLVIVAVLVGSLLISPVGCARPEPIAKTPVKIGFSGCLTGPAGEFVRTTMLYGGQLAVKHINAEGGILGGRQVELVVYDNKGIPEEAITVAEKMITRDRVKAIVGLFDASLALPTKEVALEAGIPLVVEVAMHKDLRTLPGEVGILHIEANNAQAILPQCRWVENVLKCKSAVMIGPETAFLLDAYDAFRRVWDRSGSPVKFHELIPYPWGAPDVTGPLGKAVALNPDLVLSFAWGQIDTVQMYKTLDEVGYKGAILQCFNTHNQSVADAAGSYGEGVYAATTWWPEDHPKSLAYAKEFWEEYGLEPLPAAQTGFTGVMVLCLAMDKAGTDDDVNAIWKAMLELKWEGLGGYEIAVDKYGQVLWPKYTFIQTQNGKVVKVGEEVVENLIEYMDYVD